MSVYDQTMRDIERHSPGGAAMTTEDMRERKMANLPSGSQREVVMLYRALLKCASRRPDAESRVALMKHIKTEFRKHQGISRYKVTAVEWHVQLARRKLDDLLRMRPTDKFTML